MTPEHVAKPSIDAGTVLGAAFTAGTGATLGHAALHAITATAMTTCTVTCAPVIVVSAGIAGSVYLFYKLFK